MDVTLCNPLAGYASLHYGASLTDFGALVALPKCGGWALERSIAGTTERDAMGGYPLFACQDWSRLRDDLGTLGNRWVSLVLVADPFGGFEVGNLKDSFDLVLPYKEHFVSDLSLPVETISSAHHRYYARKARGELQTEVVPEPLSALDEWMALYALLIERHSLKGLKAFSRKAFAQQLCLSGLVMLRARYKDETVGAHLWLAHGEVAYSHLAAFTALGYRLGAAYALYEFALRYFSGKAGWLDLGAGAGLQDRVDGLSQFKKGWSTGTRTAFLCGKIFDRQKYAQLSDERCSSAANYFPAYRAGEFG